MTQQEIIKQYNKAKADYDTANTEYNAYELLYIEMILPTEDTELENAVLQLLTNKDCNLKLMEKRQALREAEQLVLDTGKQTVERLSGKAMLAKVLPAFETHHIVQRKEIIKITLDLLSA